MSLYHCPYNALKDLHFLLEIAVSLLIRLIGEETHQYVLHIFHHMAINTEHPEKTESINKVIYRLVR